MLYTQGNDLTRIQCAFVDTPEVERIAEYIGSQKAYAEAHLLARICREESIALGYRCIAIEMPYSEKQQK